MSVSIANVHVVRISIHALANANAHGKYDALHQESSVRILVGVSVIIMEYVSHHSNTAIVTVNASAQVSSTAHVGRCLATRHVIVFASKGTIVPNHKSLMRKLASVSAQQSSYA